MAIVRLSAAGEGQLYSTPGILHANGRVTWRPAFRMARPADIPDGVLDRNLILTEAWLSYHQLDYDANRNFQLLEGVINFRIGDRYYAFIAPSPDARLDTGRLSNVSTRAHLATAKSDVIAGFVIEDCAHLMLIRVVGPSLGHWGVTDPTPDPTLALTRDGQTIDFNDNWSTATDAEALRRAAASVGAFPLDEGSRDAARLVRLAPGAYTVVAGLAGPHPVAGTILIEVYSVLETFDANEASPATAGGLEVAGSLNFRHRQRKL